MNVFCFTQDPNERAPQFDVLNTPYTLRAMDTMADREVRLKIHVFIICADMLNIVII